MSTSDDPEAFFMRTLGVPRLVAHALCATGMTTLEELAYIPIDELLTVAGVEEWLLLQLRQQAREQLLSFRAR